MCARPPPRRDRNNRSKPKSTNGVSIINSILTWVPGHYFTPMTAQKPTVRSETGLTLWRFPPTPMPRHTCTYWVLSGVSEPIGLHRFLQRLPPFRVQCTQYDIQGSWHLHAPPRQSSPMLTILANQSQVITPFPSLFISSSFAWRSRHPLCLSQEKII